ncbi:MAG: hypothetical protein ACREL5_00140 [Gemmatimonadales bacterium]
MSVSIVRQIFVLAALGGIAGAARGGAQTAVLSADTDLAKDSSGAVALVHLTKGTAVKTGAVVGGWTVATVDGWIAADALHDDKRAGFDVSVAPQNGTPMRARPVDGAVLGTARFGALFNRADTAQGWAHVRRTGWIVSAALTAASAAGPAATPPASAAPASTPGTTILGGSVLALSAGGSPAATLGLPIPAQVLGHQGGWAHVRIDGWVRDGVLADGSPAEGITAAQLRADPDKYVGQTVEWTVQVLAVQIADELRPELPQGEPYVLARGPLPESGFVYIGVTKDQADMFRRLEPLAKVRIRATIKAGRSKFLPTPVLTFVQRIE